MTDGDDWEYVDEKLLVLPKQREMITYHEKWGAARGGQRAGKTTAWVYWLLFERLEPYPESNAVCVGATYQQLREGIFGTLQDTLWKHGYEDGKDFVYRGSPRPWIRFSNGAKLHSWSAEIVARVRSANVQTIVCEEPQTWGPHAVAAWESLAGRLTHNERTAALYPELIPQGRMSFNPSGVGPGHWLYEMLEKRWPEEGWRCWQLSVRENSILQKADPTYIRNLEISIGVERHAVEIDGEYATMGGEVYRNYDYAVHHTVPDGMPPLEYADDRPIMWTADFNVQHMRSEIGQPHMQPKTRRMVPQRDRPPVEVWDKTLPEWQDRILYFVDEISLPDERSATKSAGAEDLVPALMGRCGDIIRRNGLYVYGDPSGGNRSQMISGSNPVNTVWKQIFADLRKHGVQPNPEMMTRQGVLLPNHYIVRVVHGLVHPLDHINLVNAQLKTSPGPEPQAGYGALISHRCVELLDDFRMVKYAPGTNKVDKKTKPESEARRTHAADAAGYMIYVERSLAFERRKFTWTLDR